MLSSLGARIIMERPKITFLSFMLGVLMDLKKFGVVVVSGLV
jgi:hypothetical protein